MIVEKVVVGLLQENCYVISKNNNCIVIDPGDEYNKIKKLIGSKNVVAILITHKHPDHIGALKKLLNDYNVEVLNYNSIEFKKYKIFDFEFEVLDTKGHSSDSVTYYFNDENIMFVGDFIFKLSIGRTDLPTGNYNEMMNSIKFIKNFPNNTIIYPGHYEDTTLEYEKNNNQWFK